MKASNYPMAQFLKCVLAGQPGRAKSSAGLTFPQPMLIWDFDGKLEGPLLYARRKGIDVDKIEIKTMRDYQGQWEQLDKDLKMYAKDPGPYKTFGFDSLTSLADFLLGFTGENKAKEGGGKKVAGIQVAGIDEYNAETSGLMDMLLFMKDVKANVWLTAHVLETRTQEIEKKTVTVNRSLLTGGKKAAAKIPAYFPENYAFNVEQPVKEGDPVKFLCYTQSNGEDYARTSYPLPAKIDFTNGLFYKIMMDKIKAAIEQPNSK